jgi:hypothetical protein
LFRWLEPAEQSFEFISRERGGTCGAGGLPVAPTLEELTACISELSSLRLRAEGQQALLTLQAQAQRLQSSAAAALAASGCGNGNGKVPNAQTVEELTAEGVLLQL